MQARKTAPNPIDKHVGSRVRMRRVTVGLSQEKVAHALGLTFQQVQKYEKGTNRISSSRLHQLARILEVPIPFFFDGAPQQPARSQDKAEAANYVNDFLATDEGRTLARAFTRIKSSKLRRSIVHLVEQLASGD